MKKILLFIYIGFLVFINISISKAQTDSLKKKKDTKFLFSVSGGISMPIEDFADYHRTDDYYMPGNTAGAAQQGYYEKASFDYLFSKYFGATAIIYTSANNGGNLAGFKFIYSGGGGYSGFNSYTTITYYNYTTNYWYNDGILVGLSARKRIYFVTFCLKASAGLQQVKCPETTIMQNETINNHSNWGPVPSYYMTNTIYQPTLYSHNYVGNVGFDCSFNLSKRIKLNIGWDLFFSKASFSGNQTILYSEQIIGNATTYYTKTSIDLMFTKNITINCFNAGVSYGFK